MLLPLAILHLVALFFRGVCTVPISNIDSPKDGDLRMYELLDEYFRDKDMHKNIDENKYPSRLGDLGTDKRGKYSWSVAYGKRDRWIAYGKRKALQDGGVAPESSQRLLVSADAPRDMSIYDNNEMKRQQAWRTRWGKKRTTVSMHPTTRAMSNYDSKQSYEGFFTQNPTPKRQQWAKFPWGKRSY